MNRSLIYAVLFSVGACGMSLAYAKNSIAYKTDEILRNVIEANRGMRFLMNECCTCERVNVPMPVLTTHGLVSTITEEGSYCLPAGFDGVQLVIDASQVNLDLNGNSIGQIEIIPSHRDIVIAHGFAKSMSVNGQDAQHTIKNIQVIHVVFDNSDAFPNFQNVNGLTLKECTFTNNGVQVFYNHNVEILDCVATITYAKRYSTGFDIETSNNVLLRDCVSAGFDYGFYCGDCEEHCGGCVGVEIQDCVAENTIRGIGSLGFDIETSTNVLVRGCSAAGFEYGFDCYLSCNTVNFIECIAVENQYGFDIYQEETDPGNTAVNCISCVTKSNGTGFEDYGANTGLIKECVAENNDTGFKQVPHASTPPNLVFYAANFAASNTTDYDIIYGAKIEGIGINTTASYWSNVHPESTGQAG